MDDVKLALRDGGDDWWVIERAEHDDRMWLEQTGPNSSSLMCSARISDADIEGPPEHILALACAIKARGEHTEKRCAVRVEGDRAFFWSPRNSQRKGETSLACADALADEILAKLAPGTPATT